MLRDKELRVWTLENLPDVDDSNGNSRRSSDTGWLHELPPKARAWAILTMVLGVPGVISLYVVYIGTKSIPAISADLIAMKIELAHHQEEMIRTTVEQKILLQQILLTQQLVCAQGEKTLEGKQRCFGR
jgi:hypothetical protein